MRHFLGSFFCVVACFSVSFAQNDQKSSNAVSHVIGKMQTTKDGVQYIVWKDKQGITPQIGDVISYNMRVNIADSIMFDTYKMNNGKPMEMPLTVNPSATKSMDPFEVIQMLSAGDSASIFLSLDSAARSMFTFAKPTDKLQFQFSMVDVKTKAQYESEMKSKQSSQALVDDKILTDYFAKNNIVAKKTSNGLYYVISKKGVGLPPKSGTTVKVNYSGKTLDGKMFDSNIMPEFQHMEPLEFTLGQGMVIAGWDEGIALLNKGAKATLYLPSTLAYGAQSPNPQIPENGILIFDVELLDFK